MGRKRKWHVFLKVEIDLLLRAIKLCPTTEILVRTPTSGSFCILYAFISCTIEIRHVCKLSLKHKENERIERLLIKGVGCQMGVVGVGKKCRC